MLFRSSFKWILPADVKLVRGKLTDATIEVEALKEGKPEITVELTNAQGTGSFKGVAFVLPFSLHAPQ